MEAHDRRCFHSHVFGINHEQFTRFLGMFFSKCSYLHCHVWPYIHSQPESLDCRFVLPHFIASVPSWSDWMEFELTKLAEPFKEPKIFVALNWFGHGISVGAHMKVKDKTKMNWSVLSVFSFFLASFELKIRFIKPILTAVGIHCADHATPSTRKGWQ
jgi:hypothetical protein